MNQGNQIKTASTYTYVGVSQDGYIRLRSSNQELLIVGTLYAEPIRLPGAKKILLAKLNGTPGHQKSATDKTYKARNNTGERVRVIGTVHKTISTAVMVAPRPRPLVAASPSSSSAPAARPAKPLVVAPKAAPPQATQPKKSTKPSTAEALAKELKRVEALRKMGDDPEVRMAFVAHYMGESASNLYKKIAAGKFPEPTRRSGGSWWRLSTLDSYRNGET